MASNCEDSSSYSDEESVSRHSEEDSLSSVDLDVSEDEDPLATKEEQAAYSREIEREEAEETELSQRFRSETVVSAWCNCSCCSLEHVVKELECRCCLEIEPIAEKLVDDEEEYDCITQHPAFEAVCLNRYVLDVSGVGLKTKQNRAYTTLLNKGSVTQSEYFRAVAYRQFVRFIWRYVGANRRFPLPACVYNKIRCTFPDEQYRGFEEPEDDESDDQQEG